MNRYFFHLLLFSLLSQAVGTDTLAQPSVFFLSRQDFGAGDGPISVAVADFNADLRPDLAVANGGSNNVSILLGNGDGTFAAARNFGAGDGPNSVAVADFNADSVPDLAVTNARSDNVSIFLGNGDGTFAAARNFGVGSFPVFVAVADFNADLRPDLAVTNFFFNNVSILLGNGDGTFAAAQNFEVGSNPISVAVADFNADLRPDLAVANPGSDNVSILLSAPGPLVFTQVFNIDVNNRTEVYLTNVGGDTADGGITYTNKEGSAAGPTIPFNLAPRQTAVFMPPDGFVGSAQASIAEGGLLDGVAVWNFQIASAPAEAGLFQTSDPRFRVGVAPIVSTFATSRWTLTIGAVLPNTMVGTAIYNTADEVNNCETSFWNAAGQQVTSSNVSLPANGQFSGFTEVPENFVGSALIFCDSAAIVIGVVQDLTNGFPTVLDASDARF